MQMGGAYGIERSPFCMHFQELHKHSTWTFCQ